MTNFLLPKGLIALLVAALPVMATANVYDDLITKYSSLEGLDPNLVKSVIYRESAFNKNALSPKGAQGLMQVMPGTADFVGVSRYKLYDPETNIMAGTRYLAYLNKIFSGDVIKILAGYNAGHGAVLKYKGVPPYRETQNYVRAVSDRYIALSNGQISNPYPTQNYTVARNSYQQPNPNFVIQQVVNSDTTIYSRRAMYAQQVNPQQEVNNHDNLQSATY